MLSLARAGPSGRVPILRPCPAVCVVKGHGRRSDAAAMLSHDTVDHVQAQPDTCADASGGEKRLEDARQHAGGDAGAALGHYDYDIIVLVRSQAGLGRRGGG